MWSIPIDDTQSKLSSFPSRWVGPLEAVGNLLDNSVAVSWLANNLGWCYLNVKRIKMWPKCVFTVFRFRKLPWTNDASAELNTTICSQSLYSLFLYTGSMMKALEGCVIRVWYSFYSCINGCFSWIHPPPSSRFGMAVCWLFHMHEGGGES